MEHLPQLRREPCHRLRHDLPRFGPFVFRLGRKERESIPSQRTHPPQTVVTPVTQRRHGKCLHIPATVEELPTTPQLLDRVMRHVLGLVPPVQDASGKAEHLVPQTEHPYIELRFLHFSIRRFNTSKRNMQK